MIRMKKKSTKKMVSKSLGNPAGIKHMRYLILFFVCMSSGRNSFKMMDLFSSYSNNEYRLGPIMNDNDIQSSIEDIEEEKDVLPFIEVPQDVEFFDGYHFDVATATSTDKSSSSSSEHYHCRLQQSTTTSGSNETLFKDYYYNSTSTHPTKNLLNWIGCGSDGHAFTVFLGCSSTHQEQTQKLFYEVVLKVSTSGKPSEQLGYKFIPFEDSKREEMSKVYKTLLMPKHGGKESTLARTQTSNSKRTLRKYFKLPFGTIKIPLYEIYSAIQTSRNDKHPPNCRIGVQSMNRTSTSGEVVTAMLVEKANGVKAVNKKLYTTDKWYKLIKDLILSYEHMYHTEFIHQDISLSHVMVKESKYGIQTQFIDFDRHNLLHHRPVQDKKRLQRVQFYQLLALLANVCDDNNPEHHHRPSGKFPIPNRIPIKEDVKRIKNRTFIQELIVPLVTSQRCVQIFQPPLSLLSNTTESNNVTSSTKTAMLTSQLYPYLTDAFGGKDTIKDDISDGYKIFLHWIQK